MRLLLHISHHLISTGHLCFPFSHTNTLTMTLLQRGLSSEVVQALSWNHFIHSLMRENTHTLLHKHASSQSNSSPWVLHKEAIRGQHCIKNFIVLDQAVPIFSSVIRSIVSPSPARIKYSVKGLWLTGRGSLAVPRHGERLPLLGLEEGVGERDGVHACHAGVQVELRVDVEEHGHVHLLFRVQTLLLKTEALRDRDTHTHTHTRHRHRHKHTQAK